MTIDERLDRLVERHEALTQSIEMHEHDIKEIHANINKILAMQEKNQEMISNLIEIMKSHDKRITNLENK